MCVYSHLVSDVSPVVLHMLHMMDISKICPYDWAKYYWYFFPTDILKFPVNLVGLKTTEVGDIFRQCLCIHHIRWSYVCACCMQM